MNEKILFARHGLQKADLFTMETGEISNAGKLFEKTLDILGKTSLAELTEEIFMEAIEEASRMVDGPGRETLIDPTKDELPLSVIDTYMRGIVRWMNELGIHTVNCCDGHERRPASIDLLTFLTMKQIKIIKACTPATIRVRFQGKKITLDYKDAEIQTLLDMAENLYILWNSEINLVDLEANKFKNRLIEVLNIPGASGNERRIRTFLQSRLHKSTDYTYVDSAGNLLAYKYCGEGPTILLSAHMDTVAKIAPGRQIIENGTILTSSEGILGADDRAGIAVILEVLSNINQTNFNGTIKIAFTVNEEIGCVGSREIDKDFLIDVDGAIVIDRRGKRDIVTSYAGYIPFCTEEYGKLFEQAGILAGMDDWKTTPGGLSDARFFAENGIPSVNLSAGYQHEHTDNEIVDYKATYETVKLVEGVLHYQLIK